MTNNIRFEFLTGEFLMDGVEIAHPFEVTFIRPLGIVDTIEVNSETIEVYGYELEMAGLRVVFTTVCRLTICPLFEDRKEGEVLVLSRVDHEHKGNHWWLLTVNNQRVGLLGSRVDV